MAPIDPWILTQKEAVRIDKFQPTYPDRIYRPRVAAHLYPAWQIVDPLLKFVTFRCWPIYPEKIYRPRVLAHLHPAWQVIDPWILTRPEDPTLTKWLPTYPDMVFRGKLYVLKPVLVQEGWLGLTIVPAPYTTLGRTPVTARFREETPAETRLELEVPARARWPEDDIDIDLVE